MQGFGGGGTERDEWGDVGVLSARVQRGAESWAFRHDADLAAVRRATDSRFELLGRLGCGANGSVFEALDRRSGTRVAIKALRERYHLSPDLRARFTREASILARLRHPNVIALRELCESDGVLFMVLELVDGSSLAQRLEEVGRLPVEETVRVMHDLASALVHVHQSGIVHRDVKPDNVLVSVDGGRAVLTDFGIAALERDDPWGAGWAPGTPQFMPPEQSEGRSADPRCDIYSLGVVGYRMLSGILPFDGRDVALIAASHRDLAPPPLAALAPDAPLPLVRIIEQCLAKRPASRFRGAADLRSALAAA